VDLGKLGYEASAGGTAVQRGEASLDATTLDLLATLPVADVTTVFLRLGAGSMDSGQVFSNPALGAAFANESSSATNAHFGTGVEVRMTDAFSARLEWEAFRLADNRVLDSTLSALTASVLYRFGASKPAPASQAAASITARGLSNEWPLTTLAQCPGERSPALIACLQPDRRVEVQVSGTRAP